MTLQTATPENKVSIAETLEKARGRVETRRCSVTSDIDWFHEKGLWKNLKPKK